MLVCGVNRPWLETAIVVPTYWTRAGGRPLPGDAVYDHPTPVDQWGTLGRLLESLCILDVETFHVLVLVAVTAPEVESAAIDRVAAIVAKHQQLHCLVVGNRDLSLLTRDPAAGGLLGFEGYARVRNVQLAVPLALGARAVVALDDDEVVRDAGFLTRIHRSLGAKVHNNVIAGLGGYYEDASGSIQLNADPKFGPDANIYDRKAAIMNAATAMLEAQPERVVLTPFCFGGNMSFTRELASTVCFDPAITRGEDIDYLINARLAGHDYFMDKDLRIVHLPPTGGSYQDVAWHKVVQDVLRFVYERAKLTAATSLGGADSLSAHDFDPYPGLFLGDRLESDSREVIARVFAATSAEEQEVLGVGASPDEFMHRAREHAEAGVSTYVDSQSSWRRLAREWGTRVDESELLLQRLAANAVGSQ